MTENTSNQNKILVHLCNYTADADIRSLNVVDLHVYCYEDLTAKPVDDLVLKEDVLTDVPYVHSIARKRYAYKITVGMGPYSYDPILLVAYVNMFDRDMELILSTKENTSNIGCVYAQFDEGNFFARVSPEHVDELILLLTLTRNPLMFAANSDRVRAILVHLVDYELFKFDLRDPTIEFVLSTVTKEEIDRAMCSRFGWKKNKSSARKHPVVPYKPAAKQAKVLRANYDLVMSQSCNVLNQDQDRTKQTYLARLEYSSISQDLPHRDILFFCSKEELELLQWANGTVTRDMSESDDDSTSNHSDNDNSNDSEDDHDYHNKKESPVRDQFYCSFKFVDSKDISNRIDAYVDCLKFLGKDVTALYCESECRELACKLGSFNLNRKIYHSILKGVQVNLLDFAHLLLQYGDDTFLDEAIAKAVFAKIAERLMLDQDSMTDSESSYSYSELCEFLAAVQGSVKMLIPYKFFEQIIAKCNPAQVQQICNTFFPGNIVFFAKVLNPSNRKRNDNRVKMLAYLQSATGIVTNHDFFTKRYHVRLAVE